MGASVKGPEMDRSALIIVDMQNDFLIGTIPTVKSAADAFRETGRPVVYVAHVMKPDYSDAAWPYWRLGMDPGSRKRTHCVEGTWGHRSSMS